MGESELHGHFIKYVSNLSIKHQSEGEKKYVNEHDFPMAGSSLVNIEGLEDERVDGLC